MERRKSCCLCGGKKNDSYLVCGAVIADLCTDCLGMMQVRGCTILPVVSLHAPQMRGTC
jgi:hypothetical protein